MNKINFPWIYLRLYYKQYIDFKSHLFQFLLLKFAFFFCLFVYKYLHNIYIKFHNNRLGNKYKNPWGFPYFVTAAEILALPQRTKAEKSVKRK